MCVASQPIGPVLWAATLPNRSAKFWVADVGGELPDVLYQFDSEYIGRVRGEDFLYQFQSESPATKDDTALGRITP